MSETPELRLPTPGAARVPGDMPTGGHAGPLLTVAAPTRRAPVPPPARPGAYLDVSTVPATRPRPAAPATPSVPPLRLTFVARPPASPAEPGAGPVLTLSIVDSSPGDTGTPGLVVAPDFGRLPVIASAAGVVLVLVAAGVAAQRLPVGEFTAAPDVRPTRTTAAPTRTVPTRTTAPRPSATTSPARTSASPSASPSATRPVVPDLALGLTDAAALGELELQSRDGAPVVAGLAGSWVPQLSFKCPGLRVDLGPNWVPDGVDDTDRVTVQQILAFHLGLRQRFGALTVHPTQLGMTADRGTSGACARQTIWMSVVPQAFGSAQAAKNWCDANALPARECSARYVARPGERSTQVDRT